MALTPEYIKKKKWEIDSPTARDIFKHCFLRETTQFEIVENLFKKKLKEKKREIRREDIFRQSIKNIVSLYIKTWKEIGYIKYKGKKKIPYSKKINKKQNNYADFYEADLTFFADYVNTKNKINALTKKEIDFLEAFFYERRKYFLNELKDDESIIDRLLKYYIRENFSILVSNDSHETIYENIASEVGYDYIFQGNKPVKMEICAHKPFNKLISKKTISLKNSDIVKNEEKSELPNTDYYYKDWDIKHRDYVSELAIKVNNLNKKIGKILGISY